ncbi:MAG TPA: gfo/Idh/MocA family oxidoreductase, partial [Planctomycetaceae bacterium]|nr:gfo/Idh/MocA family oxidoreductase [Planctomycetaceae bacterium]
MALNRSKWSRRRFLATAAKASTVLAVPQIVPDRALGKSGTVAPSERVVMGGLGIGRRGGYDLGIFLQQPDVQFVAICDARRERRHAVKAMADKTY